MNIYIYGIYEVIHGSHSLLEILRWITLMSVSFNKNDVTQAKNVYKLWLSCIKTFQLETIRMLPSASILNYTTLADVTNSWKIVDCNGNAIRMLQTVGIQLEC
jgi:hypothetical protein